MEGWAVVFVNGPLKGEVHIIASNKPKQLTIDGTWSMKPKEGELFAIHKTYSLGFGDYTGLAFFNGVFFPIWAGNSADGTLDMYSAKVVVVNQNPPSPAPGLGVDGVASGPVITATTVDLPIPDSTLGSSPAMITVVNQGSVRSLSGLDPNRVAASPVRMTTALNRPLVADRIRPSQELASRERPPWA
jgi:hypothetical protein